MLPPPANSSRSPVNSSSFSDEDQRESEPNTRATCTPARISGGLHGFSLLAAAGSSGITVVNTMAGGVVAGASIAMSTAATFWGARKPASQQSTAALLPRQNPRTTIDFWRGAIRNGVSFGCGGVVAIVYMFIKHVEKHEKGEKLSLGDVATAAQAFAVGFSAVNTAQHVYSSCRNPTTQLIS